MQRVILNITGTQREDGSDERVELITEGRLIKKPDGLLIEYDESELTGIEGCTTTLVFADDSVTIERNGTFSMQMVFSPGRVFDSSMQTPYGSVSLHLFASKVESRFNDKEGSVRLEYELSLGSLSTFNKLDLTFKSMEDCVN